MIGIQLTQKISDLIREIKDWVASNFVKKSGDTMTGKLNADGGIRITTTGGSWISQGTPTNNPIVITPAIPVGGSRYDGIIGGSFEDGSTWNIGGILKSIYVAQFDAGRTANGIDNAVVLPLNRGVIDVGNAVTNITRSGTTFTATRADGTTFNFTQQDNNTTNYLYTAAVNGSSHAVAIQNWFNTYKSTVPRGSLISLYSSAYSNGSQYMGMFISGYDANPYGGFFVCHYTTPYYVGIINGVYTQKKLLTDVDFKNATGIGDQVGGLSSWRGVANNTTTSLMSITLSPGVWLIVFGAAFDTNANGRREVTINSANAWTDAIDRKASCAAAPGAATILKQSLPWGITSTTTFYLWCYQNSGTTLNVQPYLTAVRVGIN